MTTLRQEIEAVRTWLLRFHEEARGEMVPTDDLLAHADQDTWLREAEIGCIIAGPHVHRQGRSCGVSR